MNSNILFIVALVFMLVSVLLAIYCVIKKKHTVLYVPAVAVMLSALILAVTHKGISIESVDEFVEQYEHNEVNPAPDVDAPVPVEQE